MVKHENQRGTHKKMKAIGIGFIHAPNIVEKLARRNGVGREFILAQENGTFKKGANSPRKCCVFFDTDWIYSGIDKSNELRKFRIMRYLIELLCYRSDALFLSELLTKRKVGRMWQQNQKPKLGVKKTSRTKTNKRPMHFRRVRATMKILDSDDGQILEGRVVLNDLRPGGMLIYLAEFIEPGSEIAVTLEEPKGLFLKGRAERVEDFNQSSHIMSDNPFSFRVHMEIVYEDEDERSRIAEICEQVMTEILYPVMPVKKAA